MGLKVVFRVFTRKVDKNSLKLQGHVEGSL